VILLARHGETDDNARGVVQGWLDTPLNDLGREQARGLAREAAGHGLAAIWTSQLSRALETAAIVGEATGLEPRVDERLAESRRGAWEGRALADIQRDEPGAWAAWRRGGADFRFPSEPDGPPAESLAEHQSRVTAVLGEVRAGPLPALVVAHGGTIRCALCAVHPRGLEAFFDIPVPNATLIPLAPPDRDGARIP
jgi:probable phosphoglycerate mutase